MPKFRRVNTVLGNLKTGLSGAYHSFDFSQYAAGRLVGHVLDVGDLQRLKHQVQGPARKTHPTGLVIQTEAPADLAGERAAKMGDPERMPAADMDVVDPQDECPGVLLRLGEGKGSRLRMTGK